MRLHATAPGRHGRRCKTRGPRHGTPSGDVFRVCKTLRRSTRMATSTRSGLLASRTYCASFGARATTGLPTQAPEMSNFLEGQLGRADFAKAGWLPRRQRTRITTKAFEARARQPGVSYRMASRASGSVRGHGLLRKVNAERIAVDGSAAPPPPSRQTTQQEA